VYRYRSGMGYRAPPVVGAVAAFGTAASAMDGQWGPTAAGVAIVAVCTMLTVQTRRRARLLETRR
jgi:hypothetical protein